MASIFPETEAGVSAELFLFTRSTRVQAYTTADVAIVYNGRSYEPETIKRGSIQDVFSPNRNQCTIEASIDSVFDFLVSDAPHDTLTVTIYRYNRTSGAAQVAFVGDMKSYELSERQATAIFESTGFVLDTIAPKITMITTCNHAVYDEHCALERDSWKIPARVQAVNYTETTFTLTVESIYGGADSFGNTILSVTDVYLGFSVAMFNGVYRLITSAITDPADPTRKILTLLEPFPATAPIATDMIYVYPGCDKQILTCLNKFNNLSHFMGCAAMPWNRKTGDVVPLVYGTQKLSLKNTIAEGTGQTEPGVFHLTDFWSVLCYGPIEFVYIYGSLVVGDNSTWPQKMLRASLDTPARLKNWFTNYNDGTGADAPAIYYLLDTHFTPPQLTHHKTPLPGVAHVYIGIRNELATNAVKKAEEGAATVFVTVRRTLSESPVTPYWIIGGSAVVTGASPAAAIYDLLTNTLYGAGIPAKSIDLASFDTVSEFCEDREYALNEVWEKKTTYKKIIDDICDTYGLLLTVNSTGQLKLIALTSTPVMTAVRALTEDDIISISLTTQSWADTYNVVYDETTSDTFPLLSTRTKTRLEVCDTPNQLLTGTVRKKKVDISLFKASQYADYMDPIYRRLYEMLNEVSSPKGSGSVRVRIAHDDLLPGQAVRITYAPHNISGVYRITERNLPDADSNAVDLHVVQISPSQYSTSYQVGDGEAYRTGDLAGINYERLYFAALDDTSAVSALEYDDLASIIARISMWYHWDTTQGMIRIYSDTEYPTDPDFTINDEGVGPGGGHYLSITLDAKHQEAIDSNTAGELFVEVANLPRLL